MRVLLSIKPEYAKQIFDGSKKYEFRRTIFKDENVKTVVVYVSSPVKKVVGEFEIDLILKEDIGKLWKRTKRYAGIDETLFYEYFTNKEQGFAIKIRSVRKYKKPLCLKKDFNLLPPQSFLYLKN